MAQTVYSVNAVGYVNLDVKTGFQLIANPLTAEDNTVAALLADAPDNTQVFMWDPGTSSYSVNTKFFGAWTDTTEELAPGQGAFLLAPSDFTITFVGDVPQGDLSQSVPAGFSIQASQVPQAGLIMTDLGFPGVDNDQVFKFDNAAGAYTVYTLFFGSWTPEEPTLNVAESVFVSKGADSSWDRTFSVND
jgi:hypothetical protein